MGDVYGGDRVHELKAERDALARRVEALEALLSEARGWIATDRPWNAQDLIARVNAALADDEAARR